MRQQRQQRQIAQHTEWKKIMIWLLAAVLAVTMSVPVTAFAAGTEGADRAANQTALVDPAGPTDPIFSAEDSGLDSQGNPSGRVQPAGAVDPAGPGNPADPGNPTDAAGSTDPADPASPVNLASSTDRSAPTEPIDPTDPTNPTDPTDPGEQPQYFSVYRIEVDDSGTMTCWWYDETGMKSGEPEKDKYFIVSFDKGSKTEGTAKVKVGKTGILYYFNKNGKGRKHTGWFKQSGKKYYFKKGKRFKGVKKIKKTWYEFSGKNGQLLRKIGDGVDKKIQPYTSSTSYMIIVKLTEHKVRIYNGKKNKWKRIHTYKCTVGAASTPTVKGTFTVGTKGLYFNTGTSARCWYYTQFHGNYLFHSIIYDRSSSPCHVLDGRLGISASHGCIRLALKNAKWIYYNIPGGTKVVIY